MNSKVRIFGIILLFGTMMLLILTSSSFSTVNAQEYHNYYNDKQRNFAEIERFDDTLFVCDNGIVVDDRTQCPLKCPFGTTLDGAYVMDLEICDIEPGTASKKCPPGTDLEGVLVTNKNQCEIFSECDADSPLGLSLGGLEPVRVVDIQLCQLSAPSVEICDSGFFEGFAVDNQQTCNTVFDQVSVCGPTTDLAGMLTTDIQNCNIFTTCDANSNLGEALGNTPIDVSDPELCNLELPEQTELFICDLDTPMGGAIVTDEQLCEAPNSDNKCPAETDLEGVYVMNTDSDCNIFATCDAGTALGKALGMQNEFKVADEVLCDLEIPEQVQLFQCIGGPMEGAIVTDEQLCEAPNSGNKCPQNSDLPGVYVMNPDTQCQILYDICDASTPLGQALNLGPSDTVEVADDTICQLSVIPQQLETCGPDSTLGEGAQVTDLSLCNIPTDAVKCNEGTTMDGIFVMEGMEESICQLDFPICGPNTGYPNAIVTDTQLCNIVCGQDTALPDAVVTDERLCNLDSSTIDDLITCETGPMAGAMVTDSLLCQAPNNSNKCDDNTDLPGVYVMSPEQCNLNLQIPETIECDPDSRLVNSTGWDINTQGPLFVTNPSLCQTSGVIQCPEDSPLAIAEDVAANNTNVLTFVLEEELCELSKQSKACEICALMTAMISDLPDETLITALIGVPQNNLWTACDSNDQGQEFLGLFAGAGIPTLELIILAGQFQTCMDNT